MTPKRQHVVFFHPDLGIGGAERLIIDAAVGLQDLGHQVTVYTSHCDPKHCFDEARDGTLDVRVRGNTIFPTAILGRFAILCAILRQLHLILQIAFFSAELDNAHPTVFFVDQLSAGIPLLRLLRPSVPTIFYCHFPDKLLSQKGGLLKTLYRGPFDWLESWSTGCSDTIVVNSKFTKSVFSQAFPTLKHRHPRVVYPCVDASDAGKKIDSGKPLWPEKKIILSINRYERKKDVGLAIRAYAGLTAEEKCTSRLVIAGGYDNRVPENHATYTELCALADSFGLKHATAKTVISALSIPEDISVLFLHSVPNAFKTTLLSSALLLVYTPRNEHFGIVPLEAMLAETPVLAANEGGPTETVVDGETGWLRDVSKAPDWTEVMRKVLHEKPDRLQEMGYRGRTRVEGEFSKDKMGERLNEEIQGMKSAGRRPVLGVLTALLAIGGAVGAVIGTAAWMVVARHGTV